jgi:hypothetical protein
MRLDHWARVALVGSLVLVAACHIRAPIENFEAQPIPASASSQSLDDIARQIKAAGASLDWTVEDSGPGRLIAKHRHPKGYTATVEISFSQTAYTITLLNSERFHEKDGLISAHYNVWARNLKAAIDRQLILVKS